MWHLSLRSRTSGLGIKKLPLNFQQFKRVTSHFVCKHKIHLLLTLDPLVDDSSTTQRRSDGGKCCSWTCGYWFFALFFFFGKPSWFAKNSHGRRWPWWIRWFWALNSGGLPKNPHPIFRGSVPTESKPTHLTHRLTMGNLLYPNFAKKNPRFKALGLNLGPKIGTTVDGWEIPRPTTWDI